MTKKRTRKSYRRPSMVLYTLAAWLLRPYLKLKYRFVQQGPTPSQLKPPYLMLCNHPSGLDYLPLVGGMAGARINIVTARHYFYKQPLKTILPILGAIPKQQFQVDTGAIRNIMRAAKQGGVLALFPEGEVSLTGQMGYMHPSVAKLVQWLKIPVVIAKFEGTGLCKPKWAARYRKGPVHLVVSQLWDQAQIQSLTQEEIYRGICEALAYDECQRALETGRTYRGKHLAKGLPNVLYQCPGCQTLFSTYAKGDTLYCSECGFALTVHPDGLFTTAGEEYTLSHWVAWEKQQLRAQMEQGQCSLSQNVQVRQPKKSSGFYKSGQGVLTIDQQGLHFEGMVGLRPKDLHVPIEHLWNVPYRPGKQIEVPHNDQLYIFQFQQGQAVQQLIFFAELLRNSGGATAEEPPPPLVI